MSGLDSGGLAMTKSILLVTLGLMLMVAHSAVAQTEDQCNQVRAAVAQYGYKAAKAHADATLTPDEVRAADACLKHKTAATKRHPAVSKR